MPKPGSKGHGKSGHLSDRLRRKAPWRYFTFSFRQADRGKSQVDFLGPIVFLFSSAKLSKRKGKRLYTYNESRKESVIHLRRTAEFFIEALPDDKEVPKTGHSLISH